MPATAETSLNAAVPCPGVRRSGPRAFSTNADGATAVEFGLVGIPFVMLILAILETALIFFTGQALETAVNNTGRLIRTGQAHEDSMGPADFKASVCAQVYYLVNCNSGLSLDVRTFDTFDSIDLGVVIDEEGKLLTEDFNFEIGEAGDIVVVRALYEWPTFTFRDIFNLATLANGNHVLSATAVFKNEPFPW